MKYEALGIEEIESNQNAYTEGEKEVYITNLGNTYTKLTLSDLKENEHVTKIMRRSDLDEAKPYKDLNLQTHNTPTSLDITSYNVYPQDGSKSEKPEGVIVGVAGSGDLSDWYQNLLKIDPYYRSRNSRKKVEELLRDSQVYTGQLANAKSAGVPKGLLLELEAKVAENMYVFEMQRKVQALKKYRDNHIPITLIGDSKGGEDAAFLALKSEQAGVPIDHLHLVNPKSIRIDHSDWLTLVAMNKAGKITKEIVYPEILSDIGGDGSIGDYVGGIGGVSIPCDRVVYTVPTSLNKVANHMVSKYEENVFQGMEGKYKFQCTTEKPEEIKVEVSGWGLGTREMKTIGYRYKTTSITDKAGNTISVNDYFFHEQINQITILRNKLNTLKDILVRLKNEDISACFLEKTKAMRNTLEVKHEGVIKITTPYEVYRRDHSTQFKPGMSVIEQATLDTSLRKAYYTELQNHVNEQGAKYPTVVVKRVTNAINQYKENVYNELMKMEKTISELDERIKEIETVKTKYAESQKQIQFIIEKRFN